MLRISPNPRPDGSDPGAILSPSGSENSRCAEHEIDIRLWRVTAAHRGHNARCQGGWSDAAHDRRGFSAMSGWSHAAHDRRGFSAATAQTPPHVRICEPVLFLP